MTLSDSRNKARALGRIKRLASSGLQLDPFVRGAFEGLNDGVSHSPNRVMLAGGGERIDAYIGSTEEIARATPLFHKFFVDSPPGVCGVRFPYDSHAIRNVLPSKVIWTQDDLILDHFYRAEAYNVVYRPMGWHHLLQVVFQESGEFLGYCPIWRSADQKPFSRDDTEFLRNAAPHVAHGLRAARLLERIESRSAEPTEFQQVSPWRAGIILLDSGGKLLAIDPDARIILQQIGVLDALTVDQFAPVPVREGLAYVSRLLSEIFHCSESDCERAAAPVYRIYHYWTGVGLKLRGINMLVGDSKSGPEIALLLAISHDTVRKHVGAGFGAGSESAREGSADGSAN